MHNKREKMIIDYIKEILTEQKNSISIEKLNEFLQNKTDIFNENSYHSDIYTDNNGIAFQKKSLIELKNSFFVEFEDYIKGKIADITVQKAIIDKLMFLIPDRLFVEWINISLERKILIFDLLFSFFVKAKRTRDKFKIFYSKVIDFYMLLCVSSILIIQSQERSYNKQFSAIKKIEVYEEKLKLLLFSILSVPDFIKSSLDNWESEFMQIEAKLRFLINKSFSLAANYSPRLLKRVIEKDLKVFHSVHILTRFESISLQDWLTIFCEGKENKFKHNLFEDLGIN